MLAFKIDQTEPTVSETSPVAATRFSVAKPDGSTDFHDIRALYSPRTEAAPIAAATPIRSDHDLVVQLCQMPVDLAAPLLRASLASLDTPALLALIAATGEAHHKIVARRSDLDWQVIRALIRSNSDEVLLALAENHTLDFDADDQASLARLSEDRVMLRAAILANPRLGLARSQVKLNVDDGISHRNLKLVRLLRNRQVVKFIVEAANRLDCEATWLQRILSAQTATPLALLSCALGLDRAVFLNLLPHWQASHAGEAECNAAHRPLILSVFTLPAADARRKLLAMA